jgi:DsbC/DsbD-like thiol-disulfide interchange protein
MRSCVFRYSCWALICWFVLFQQVGTTSAPTSTPHVKVTLVSEKISVQPGHEFEVGVYFELGENWHVYWINPGDSGEPPRVEWKLPPQFRVSALEWPAPRRLENGPLVDFGYENDLLLLAEVRAPANLKPGAPVELQANVRWLVCHDICIPERQTLTLSLPVASDAPKYDLRWHGLFERTRGQLPKPVPAAWRVTAVSHPGFFLLSVKTGTTERKATFFPLEPLQVKNSAPQRATPFVQGALVSLQKSDQLLHPVASLEGVLVLGQSKAYAIDVPVTSENSPGK